MKKYPQFLISLSILLCSSCASISSHKFLVPRDPVVEKYIYREDWLVDVYPEGSFGQFRPYLYKTKFNNELSYSLYPIIVKEKGVSFGPLLLPVIPIWFLPQRSKSPTKPNEVRIVWYGDEEIAKHITVILKHQQQNETAKLEVLTTNSTGIDCLYIFEKQLSVEDVLYIQHDILGEVEVKLQKRKHLCFIPYMNPFYGAGPKAKISRRKFFKKEVLEMNKKRL